MRTRLLLLALSGALLVLALPATAGAHGVGTFETCARAAYLGIDPSDPQSAERFVAATRGCTVALARDLTSPRHIEAFRQCLEDNAAHTLAEPVGWGPIFATSEAWRCVFIVYLGRDVKVPPDAHRAGERAARARSHSAGRRDRPARDRARARSSRGRARH